MERKGILVTLLSLFIICLACGCIGFFQSKHVEEPEDDPVIDNGTITYVYYLEDTEVSKAVIFDEVSTSSISGEAIEREYVFDSSTCTNGVTGDFDSVNWEFIPSEVKTSTCKLYFSKAYYKVSVLAVNGTVAQSEYRIKKSENATIPVTPTEGYEYETYSCSNSKVGSWDSVNKAFIVNTVLEDTTCKVEFKVKSLTMNVTVVGGTGNTTENASYGQSVSAVVNANEGYENPKVDCTNNQNATYSTNKVTIEKLTDSTTCTVTYQKAAEVVYTLKLNDLPFTIKIISGSMEQKIVKGNEGKFTLKADSGFEINDISCNVTPTKNNLSDGSVEYSFLNMTKDITCTVTAKVSQ